MTVHTANHRKQRRLLIENGLRCLGVGMTRALWGHMVTRWADDEFELGTWVRESTLTAAEAAAKIEEEM